MSGASSRPRFAAARDVAVVVDRARLVAPRRQPEPSADGSRFAEITGILDSGRKRGRRDGANAWNRHQDLTGLALPCADDKLPAQLGGLPSQATPRLEYGKNDAS